VLPLVVPLIIGSFGAAFACSHGNWSATLAAGAAGVLLVTPFFLSEVLYDCVARIEVGNGWLLRKGLTFRLKRIASDQIDSIIGRPCARPPDSVSQPGWSDRSPALACFG
jgi:hypothetical protein